MPISEVKEIIDELKDMGFIDVGPEQYHSDPYKRGIEKFSYIDDGDYSDPENPYDFLLFFQFSPWLFRFCYKEDSFWIWDDNVNDWVKTDITDISTLLVLYK